MQSMYKETKLVISSEISNFMAFKKKFFFTVSTTDCRSWPQVIEHASRSFVLQSGES